VLIIRYDCNNVINSKFGVAVTDRVHVYRRNHYGHLQFQMIQKKRVARFECNVSHIIPIYIQQDATLHSLFISGNCSTCFAWCLRPSSGAHTTVSTASGICHTVMDKVKLLINCIWRYKKHSVLKICNIHFISNLTISITV